MRERDVGRLSERHHELQKGSSAVPKDIYNENPADPDTANLRALGAACRHLLVRRSASAKGTESEPFVETLTGDRKNSGLRASLRFGAITLPSRKPGELTAFHD